MRFALQEGKQRGSVQHHTHDDSLRASSRRSAINSSARLRPSNRRKKPCRRSSAASAGATGGATFRRCQRDHSLIGDGDVVGPIVAYRGHEQLGEHALHCVQCVIRQRVNQVVYLGPSSHVRSPQSPFRATVPIRQGFCSMYPTFLVHCSVANHLADAGIDNELQRARSSRRSVTLSLWALWSVNAHSCAVRSRKSSRRHRCLWRTRRSRIYAGDIQATLAQGGRSRQRPHGTGTLGGLAVAERHPPRRPCAVVRLPSRTPYAPCHPDRHPPRRPCAVVRLQLACGNSMVGVCRQASTAKHPPG